jgi:hypothetical protein
MRRITYYYYTHVVVFPVTESPVGQCPSYIEGWLVLFVRCFVIRFDHTSHTYCRAFYIEEYYYIRSGMAYDLLSTSS